MQVKSSLEHSAVLLTCIKLPYGFKTFVLLFLSGCLRQVVSVCYFTGPPKIISDDTQFASKKETVRLQCLTISSPKPDSIIWTRNGEPIDYASSGRFSSPEEDLPYGRKSILQILNVQEEDFGEYNCTVKNARGKADMVIKLVERGNFSLTSDHALQHLY